MNNPDELAGLSAEVREAISEMDSLPKTFPEIALKRPVFMEGMMFRWGYLRAELLRLATENAELHEQVADWERVSSARGRTIRDADGRAERAEAELAAFKRRIRKRLLRRSRTAGNASPCCR